MNGMRRYLETLEEDDLAPCGDAINDPDEIHCGEAYDPYYCETCYGVR